MEVGKPFEIFFKVVGIDAVGNRGFWLLSADDVPVQIDAATELREIYPDREGQTARLSYRGIFREAGSFILKVFENGQPVDDEHPLVAIPCEVSSPAVESTPPPIPNSDFEDEEEEETDEFQESEPLTDELAVEPLVEDEDERQLRLKCEEARRLAAKNQRLIELAKEAKASEKQAKKLEVDLYKIKAKGASSLPMAVLKLGLVIFFLAFLFIAGLPKACDIARSVVSEAPTASPGGTPSSMPGSNEVSIE
ncbi:hypothetical protein KJ611_00690 [Patescibacteria group bacterium]|nr:hypothetical protein [Patescibacteria group bacterium]MBU1705104.1 hypothetical protein [Patescibacteria group bacterium]